MAPPIVAVCPRPGKTHQAPGLPPGRGVQSDRRTRDESLGWAAYLARIWPSAPAQFTGAAPIPVAHVQAGPASTLMLVVVCRWYSCPAER